MINVANRNAAESLVGALTSDHLNRVLALPYFHTVSIIEPWPVVEHRDVQAKSRGGEALSDLQLTARDKGGNILDESRNASITLREQTIIIQELMCKGQTHCHVPLNTSIPKGHTLIEANLDISLKCSDFDDFTEYVNQVEVDGFDLKKLARSPVNAGPFPECYNNCGKHAIVLQSYSVLSHARKAAMKGENIFYLSISVSSDVNQFPCDGYTLSALASLRLKSAAPSNPVIYRRASLVQMEGSLNLKSSTLANRAIFRNGIYLLSFTSPGIRGAELYWITVEIGNPARLLVQQQPGDSVGGFNLPSQPQLAVIDAGGNIVHGFEAQINAQLIPSAAAVDSCNYEAAAFFCSDIENQIAVISKNVSSFNGSCCKPRFCRVKVGIGIKSLESVSSFQGSNLQGNNSQNMRGSFGFSDLRVNLAADNYRLNFSATASSLYSTLTALSDVFTIKVGAAARLVLVVGLQSGIGGQSLLSNPIVGPSDLGGNLVGVEKLPSERIIVTAYIGVNGGVWAKLDGKLAEIIDSSTKCGVNFTDLSINLHGKGYTIIFRADGLLPAETPPFNVVTGPASQLILLRCANSGRTKTPLKPQPVIQISDAGGNHLESETLNISVRLLPPSSIFTDSDTDVRLQGSVNVATFRGRAFFYNLVIRVARIDWRLEFYVNNDFSQNLSDSVSRVLTNDIQLTNEPGEMSLQVDITFGQDLEAGSSTLSNVALKAWINSLAKVLGVPPEDISLLEVFVYPIPTQGSGRRQFLALKEFEVVIKFEVIVQNEIDSSAANLTKDSLENAVGQEGYDVKVYELSAVLASLSGNNVSIDYADMWSGWWVINSSLGLQSAAIANDNCLTQPVSSPCKNTTTIDVQYRYQAKEDIGPFDVACSGSVQDTIASLKCYQPSGDDCSKACSQVVTANMSDVPTSDYITKCNKCRNFNGTMIEMIAQVRCYDFEKFI
jgi:hypothetical protein